MGTPDFAVPSLEVLVRHEYEMSAVVTGMDKPRGRGQEVLPSPVKRKAIECRLPVLQPPSLKDPEFADQLRALSTDLFVVVAFRILPKTILSIPRLGAVNLHASLLPKYRGAAPIQRAIMNGEETTGLTTFFLEERVDTGTIILQKAVPILQDDDAGNLHDKLSEAGAALVLETVRRIESGSAPKIRQDESAATPAPKILKEDCVVRWNRPSGSVRDLIRALSPSPGAYTRHGNRIIKIFRSEFAQGFGRLAPGEVVVEPGRIIVGTADGGLSLTHLQQEGKRRLPVEEFLRGYRIKSGDRVQ
ncbi:MAG: methionyl-tRNA formyltransferase [Bacteroidetes bacterium]|nr:methionyl-tRNA formyltransferase [Bacteroidota bacterium]